VCDPFVLTDLTLNTITTGVYSTAQVNSKSLDGDTIRFMCKSGMYRIDDFSKNYIDFECHSSSSGGTWTTTQRACAAGTCLCVCVCVCVCVIEQTQLQYATRHHHLD
jgi:hypothetical protein